MPSAWTWLWSCSEILRSESCLPGVEVTLVLVDPLEHRSRGSGRLRPLPAGGCCRWVCLQPSRRSLAPLLHLLSSVIQGTGAGSLKTNDKRSFCHRQMHGKSFQSMSMESSTSGIPLTMAFKEKSKEMLNNADQKRKPYHLENTSML